MDEAKLSVRASGETRVENRESRIRKRSRSPYRFHDFRLSTLDSLLSILYSLALLSLLSGCVRPAPTTPPWNASGGGSSQLPGSVQLPGIAAQASPKSPAQALPGPTATLFVPPTRPPDAPVVSPTPDPPRVLPTPRTEVEQYVVQPGDTLGKIAQRYGVSLQNLIAANPTTNPDLLYTGINLTIPIPLPGDRGPDFKIIPDSELVYGPSSAGFDIAGFIQGHDGFLAHYREKVDDIETSGSLIIERIAREYSVNPRLLLAALEYRSSWLTASYPDESTRGYPMGVAEPWRTGLYRQLAWAADNLNSGYYLWRAGAISTWILPDGSAVPIDATINPGTAGVQALFARMFGREDWQQAVSPDGLFETYSSLFGHPFDLAVEPILPADLEQPGMQLPFEQGDSWSFTGGPHGGWGAGSAWAAVDFAPPGELFGCYLSSAWVTAIADGQIIRTAPGVVILDLDGDGQEQTGWTILYLHLDSSGRVKPGTSVQAGDQIGHASCEGGISNGTHVHIARRYNGEWIPADGHIPFVLDGWVSSGSYNEYDGYLSRNEQSIEAADGRSPANQIWR